VVGAAEHGADVAGAAAALALDVVAVLDGAAPRLAIHVGDALGGVVGRDRPRFEVWGEAVETAEALAAGGGPSGVLATPGAAALLREGFELEPKGVVEVGRLGTIRVHAVIGRSAAASSGAGSSVT